MLIVTYASLTIQETVTRTGSLETERLRREYAMKFGAGWERQHMSEWRREVDRVMRRHAPENFGKWLYRERADEVYEQRMDYDYRQTADPKTEREKMREPAIGALQPPRLSL